MVQWHLPWSLLSTSLYSQGSALPLHLQGGAGRLLVISGREQPHVLTLLPPRPQDGRFDSNIHVRMPSEHFC